MEKIPQEFLNKFTLNNQIPLYKYFFNDKSTKEIIWTNEIIEKIRSHYTRENILNNRHQILSIWKDRGEPYPDHRIGGSCLLLQNTIDRYPVNNKSIAVIGSILPWIECICINNGANEVTTIEYNLPKCQYPKINIMDYKFALDYAYVDYGVLDYTHQFGLKFEF